MDQLYGKDIKVLLEHNQTITESSETTDMDNTTLSDPFFNKPAADPKHDEME